MIRSRMSSRGHESFKTRPMAVTTNLHKAPTVMDMQRRAVLQMQEEEEARIKCEEDFKRDFLDFSYVTGVDEYGLPLATPYAIPDTVPDMYVPDAPVDPEENDPEEKNSVSTEGSDSEPSGGAE